MIKFPKSTLVLRNFAKNSNRKAFCTNNLTNYEVRRKRNELFEKELKRQIKNIPNLEKIQVTCKGDSEDFKLLMNKNLSTPLNCAMHLSELIKTRSVVALVNNKLWDMHKPLKEDCEIKFLHFKDKNPEPVNLAFWRTGSFILGYILETIFKENFYVELHSFPKPNIQSGSFVYDADLKINNWKPTSQELINVSTGISKIYSENIKFERLDVDASIALEMFKDNRFKSQQIPDIAAKSNDGNSITIYRMKDHVDISRGPLISTTDQILRYNVTAIHEIQTDFGNLYRAQGIAIPKQLPMHYWSYNILSERAAKLNNYAIPAIESKEKQRKMLS